MSVISDAIIGGIAWEAFSKSITFYAEGVNDFVLRVYIAGQLRALEELEGVSDEKIEEVTDIIEATIVETPEKIKEIEDKEEQEKEFKEYVRKNKYINNGTIQGIQHQTNEEGSTVYNYFGDAYKHPN